MLRKVAPSFWLVVHKCLHPYGHKSCCIVVVRPIDMSIHGDLGVHVLLSEEQYLTFRLQYGLAPEVGRETICCPTHHSNEVVLPRLNCLLCQVAPVIIWRYKLVGRACIFYFQSVRCGHFIVDYLVSNYYGLRFHMFQGAAPGQDHLPLCLFFMGSIQVELPSISCRIIWYLFPRIEL